MAVQIARPYTTRGSRNLLFDLHRQESGTLPLVVMLHGGGWISGDRTMYAEEADWLSGHGFACAAIDYRLAPLDPFPAAVADAQAFVRYAKSNAGELGIDPDRIYAFGNSAGGHLAAMLGLCDHSFDEGEPHERVEGFVSVCPITDFTDWDVENFEISLSFVEQFLGGPHQGLETTYRDASPLTYADENDPPSLLIHGAEDDVVPVSQSQKLHKSLHNSRLHILPGEAHSFTYPAWESIRKLYVDFLQELAG